MLLYISDYNIYYKYNIKNISITKENKKKKLSIQLFHYCVVHSRFKERYSLSPSLLSFSSLTKLILLQIFPFISRNFKFLVLSFINEANKVDIHRRRTEGIEWLCEHNQLWRERKDFVSCHPNDQHPLSQPQSVWTSPYIAVLTQKQKKYPFPKNIFNEIRTFYF